MDGLKKLTLVACLASAAALAACSSQSVQSGLEPKITSCSPTNVTLQFGVGTANIAGTLGLNTLVTLRQNAGTGCTAGASILDNAPTITGPASFARIRSAVPW
jgi:putative hemolysin